MSTPEKSGLVVPIVLWGKQAPTNKITHITTLCNGQTIITGTSDGQIVQWSVDASLNWIQPNLMLLAHTCAISCISPASKHPSATKYITCSEDGQIVLWDSVGGRAIDSTVQQYIHRKIVPYTYNLPDHHSQTRLFCIGDYADIIVLDAQDLNVLFFFRSQFEPDWINSLTAVKPYDKPVVIGTSVAGAIKMWSIEDLERRESSNVVYEEESKSLGIKDALSISCSNFNTRMMLVISPSSWQILDPSTLQQLIVSACKIEATNGIIIDIDKVAIGFSDATIVLFQLPRSRLCGRQIREKFGEKPANVGNIEHPFVFALLKGCPSPSTNLFSDCRINFFFDTRVVDNEIRRVAYRVDHQGVLSIWNVPKNCDSLVEEFIQSRKPSVYEPTTRQSFNDVWKKLNQSPPSIISQEKGRTITATIYVGCQGKLLLGRDDGSIIMTYACHAISAQLLDIPSTEVQQRIIVGHSAAVTCFLYPFEENQRYDPELFLSGGMDFAVIVWNIVAGTKLHRFCSQGGPILRFVVPPDNCNPRVLNCVCSIAGDNSASLLSLKENKSILLASRQLYPIIDVKWRPLDDFMLLKCEDNSVYVWQMETGNLDRIVAGVLAVDVIEACQEQENLAEYEDEAGASSAIRMLRAIKHKNISAIRKVAVGDDKGGRTHLNSLSTILPSPMDVVQLKKCSNEAHLILFNVDALIAGLRVTDHELYAALNPHEISLDNRMPFSSLISNKSDTKLSGHSHTISNGKVNGSNTAQRWQVESNLYVDTARLLISLLHAWHFDEKLDNVCLTKLKFNKPAVPLCFGTISRRGFISLYMPFCTGRLPALNDSSFFNFSKNIRWKLDRSLTTSHLLSLVSISNTMMSLKSREMHHAEKQRPILRRAPSVKSSNSATESETQQICQGWSSLTAMHCVLLPDAVKPSDSYAAPQIEQLARRWQDSCVEIREAAQALLIRELSRMSPASRKLLIDYWGSFLPTLLDPALSIFGNHLSSANSVPTSSTSASSVVNHSIAPPIPPPPVLNHDGTTSVSKPLRPPPPIPARHGESQLPKLSVSTSENSTTASTSNDNSSGIISDTSRNESDQFGGLHQVRRNQATSIIVLGVFGAEFPNDLNDYSDLTRAISHALVELLVSEESPLLPLYSPLRRAAVDLIGRGFTVWQPHVDLPKVLLGLLELTSCVEKMGGHFPIDHHHNLQSHQITPEMDACRTARHALSQIASSRAQALISALSMEVARYNSAIQHQTIQHSVTSPLLKARVEVLHLIEQLSEKQFNDVAEMIIPVGDILVHCLDIGQLKNRNLAELFPPISKFYMISYCPASRRIAFGGKNGTVVVHDLKASKSQTIQAHKAAITAVSFSQDGKFLATYSAQDARISFWQTQTNFLGMGPTQIKCSKTFPAPSEFPVLSPGGSYQSFRARLVWVNAKNLILMLPNGKENRFAI